MRLEDRRGHARVFAEVGLAGAPCALIAPVRVGWRQGFATSILCSFGKAALAGIKGAKLEGPS